MIPIDQTTVSTIAKQTTSKNNLGKNNSALYHLHSASLTNMTDLLRDFSEYEMAHFINNNERWIQNRATITSTNYERGDILMVDLGAHNFRNEPSFPHPCVVVKATEFSILVAPCSSKKYGKGYHEIIDATPADGFIINTGIQSMSYRWVNKNRVINKMGKTGNRILNALDKKMLQHIPGHKLLINQKKHEINNLNLQLESSKKQINSLKQAIDEKDEKLKQLNELLKQLSVSEVAITKEDC